MNKKIFIVFGVIIGLAILFWIGQSSLSSDRRSHQVDSPVNMALAVSEDYFDFGQVSMAAGLVERDIVIENRSAEAVDLKKIYTSCMCTTGTLIKAEKRIGPFGMPGHGGASTLKESLRSGESAILKIIFDPAAHGPAGVGRVSRLITIESENGVAAEIGFSVNVTP